MHSLTAIDDWPVAHVGAAVVLPDGSVVRRGDTDRPFRVASISKMLVGWTALVAHEEGTLHLDDPAGAEGCTVRHLLAHAGGYPFEGRQPIAGAGTRRIYSNTGIEIVAERLAAAALMPFVDYQSQAVTAPLGMHTTRLEGSPAKDGWSTVDDLVRFVAELRAPTLVATPSAEQFHTVQFPGLAGVVPGLGRFDPCDWGLGTEIRGTKQPHWTGVSNSPATFGHFGGAGTFVWIDPAVGVACVALTDRPIDDWGPEALVRWSELSDAVLSEMR